MIEQSVELAGMPRTILTAEKVAECKELHAAVMGAAQVEPIGLDIETNAHSMYGNRFAVRLVQFSTKETAWIFPVEKRNMGKSLIANILNSAPAILAHGSKYDLLGLEVGGFLNKVSNLEGRYVDTRILTHLLDPRGKEHGGVGQALKDVVNKYVDEDYKDSQKELHKHFKTLFGRDCTIAYGFRNVPLYDPVYLQYAGLDPIGTCLLFDVVGPMVAAQQS